MSLIRSLESSKKKLDVDDVEIEVARDELRLSEVKIA